MPPTVRTVLATIAVASYEPPDVELAPAGARAFDPLPRAETNVAELAAFLGKQGFEEVVALPAAGAADYAGARRALQRLAKRVRELAEERHVVDVVLVWSGHGEVVDGELRLATSDSWSPLEGTGGQSPAELARALPMTRVRQAVVVIESCHAGGGVAEIAGAVARALDRRRFADEVPNLVVIASSQKDEKSLEGLFTATLLRVLEHGPSPAARAALAELGGGLWSPHNQLLTPSEVLRVVEAELDSSLPRDGRQRPRLMLVDLDRPVFPNPNATPGAPDMLVAEAVRRAMRPEDAEGHFLRKARGLEPGEAGWRFTGRVAASRDLVGWIAEGAGLAVVTGGPGTGKSALLGRLAALSDPDYRARALADGWDQAADAGAGTVPDVAGVDAAVHARGRTRDDVAADIGSILGLAPPPTGWSAVALITAQSLAGPPPVVVVDALDEAAEPERVAKELLRPLVEGGWRVLVGTRPGIDPATGRERALLEALGPATVTVDLDAQPDTEADLVDYVLAQVADEDVARAVAGAAGGSFLYARLVTSSLRRQPSIDPSVPLAATVAAAFLDELARLDEPPEVPGGIAGILRALAWAEGRGLPLRDDVWRRVATAASATGVAYEAGHVERALHAARHYIIESAEDGQAVYRLFHQELVDALRDPAMPVDDEKTVQRAIVSALRPRRDWFDASPYVARHLVIHAADAGTLPDLLVGDDGVDLDLLAVTDPGSLRRAAGRVVGRLPLPVPESGNPDDTVLVDARWLDAVDVVTASEHVLDRLDDPRDRVAALRVALALSRPRLAARTRHPPDWTWSGGSASDLRFRSSARIPAGQRWVGIWENQWGRAEAVASGPRGLQTVPGGAWTAPSPVEVADRPLGLAPDGHAAAAMVTGSHPTPGGPSLRFRLPLAAIVGRGVLSLAYGPGNDPEELGPVPGICRSVAIGRIGGRTVVVTAADDVMVWWTDSREAVSLGAPGWATCVLSDAGRVAAAGMDGVIRLWDPVGGSHAELPTALPFVTGLASARVDSRRILAACGSGGIELFDLDGGTSERFLPGSFVLGVDVAEVGGTGVLAAGLGRGSGLVRLWELSNPTLAATLEGHDGGVWAVRIVKDPPAGATLVSVDEMGVLGFTDLRGLSSAVLMNPISEAVGGDVVEGKVGHLGSGAWKAAVSEGGFVTLGPAWGKRSHVRSSEPVLPVPEDVAVWDDDGSPAALLVQGDGTVLSWKPPAGSEPRQVLPSLGRRLLPMGADSPTVNRIVSLDDRTFVVSAFRNAVRVWDSTGPVVYTLTSSISPVVAATAGILDDEIVAVVADRISIRVVGLDGALRRDPVPVGSPARFLDLTVAGLLQIVTASAVVFVDLSRSP